MRRTPAAALLVAYLVLLLSLTLLIFPKDHPSPNLVPFRSIAHDWRVGGRAFVVNFVGNVVVFIPFGFLVPLVRARPTRPRQIAVLGLILSGSIEAMQYLSGRRVADVDDVLLNVGGGLLGYLILRGSSSRCRPSRRLLR